jgi:hypothetical protein
MAIMEIPHLAALQAAPGGFQVSTGATVRTAKMDGRLLMVPMETVAGTKVWYSLGSGLVNPVMPAVQVSPESAVVAAAVAPVVSSAAATSMEHPEAVAAAEAAVAPVEEAVSPAVHRSACSSSRPHQHLTTVCSMAALAAQAETMDLADLTDPGEKVEPEVGNIWNVMLETVATVDMAEQVVTAAGVVPAAAECRC